MERRNISNSEVTTFLTCRQQYEFAFMRNLAPKVTPKALSRGTLGHLAFQYYIEARLNGANHESAMRAGTNAFIEASRGGMKPDIVLETRLLFERYQTYHQGWPNWKLLGTEEHLELKVTDEIWIPMRYDLMVEEKDSGRIGCGDFKFTYDFWTPDDHALNPQMPKYLTIMQKNGINVQFGFLEEIRTRKLAKANENDPKKTWRRTHYKPGPTKQRNLIKQHIATSLEIMRFRELPDEEREAITIPLLSHHGGCRYCNFKELCASKLDGGDVETFIESAFVQNTYGYNNNSLELAMEDII